MAAISKADLGNLSALLGPRRDSATVSVPDLSAAGLESVRGEAEATDPRARLKTTHAFLQAFFAREFPGDDARQTLLDDIMRSAGEAVEVVLGARAESDIPVPMLRAGLEAVVVSDGSRPSFLVRDGSILLDSSPLGEWGLALSGANDALRCALRSVGRVNITHGWKSYSGTAWRVAPDLVVTNRHVAQDFVAFDTDDGVPALIDERNAHVVFGHEFKGKLRETVKVRELVFWGGKPIPVGLTDHDALDLAVLRVEPMAEDCTPMTLALGDHLSDPDMDVMLLGYPGKPDPAALGGQEETAKVMHMLFAGLWGYLRLSPGSTRPGSPAARQLRHDASTLGGSSGSALISMMASPLVLGLHYGGRWGAQSVNFAHRIESVLDEPGQPGKDYPHYQTLRDVIAAEGIATQEHDPFAGV
jgi:hypothetical protein